MRPISLELTAFGPYKDREYIDFEKISRDGIFLICGDTGSGKTMILDAMSFALFGKSTGSSRDKIEMLRCNRCSFDADTSVSFVFEQDGRVYRFERRLKRKRKNLSASAECFVQNDDGVFEPLFENAKEREVSGKAEEIIGFGYDQFRQIIVLPQGQFERFLTASSDEKEQILSNIFNVGKWQRYADSFYTIADARLRELREASQQIRIKLQSEKCGSEEELKDKLDVLKADLKELEAVYEAEDYPAQKQRLEAAKRTASVYDELDRQQRGLELLLAKGDEIKRKERELNAANSAEVLRGSIDRLKTAETAFTDRKNKLGELKRKADEEATKAAEASERLARHQEAAGMNEEHKRQKNICESRRGRYEEIDTLRLEVSKSLKELERSRKDRSDAEQSYAAAEKEMFDAREAYEHADKLHNEYMNRYLAGIYGEIAAELEDGKVCPVCGSTVHPCMAARAYDAVSREAVDAAKVSADELYEAFKTAEQKASGSKARLDEADSDFIKLESEMRIADANLRSAESDMLDGIADSKALESRIKELDESIAAYDSRLDKLRQQNEAAGRSAESLRADAKSCERELEREHNDMLKAGAELDAKLKLTEFADASEAEAALIEKKESDKLNREISEYYANIESRRRLISEKQEETCDMHRPDQEQLREDEIRLNNASKEFIEKRASFKKDISRLSELYDEICGMSDGLAERLLRAENDLGFAKQLRGDTGIGLHRYVLGIMFGSVISAANKMLENVHGGRYRLHRSDERSAGSNKRGLNLNVYDSYADGDGIRDVATLSGGEKFLVSLALSIGVSAAAAGTGSGIEAMFIDEGFGTLDDSSINDAIEIIGRIRKACGMVGIISHVGILRDNIPSKLMVLKSREGSHISVITG